MSLKHLEELKDVWHLCSQCRPQGFSSGFTLDILQKFGLEGVCKACIMCAWLVQPFAAASLCR